MCRICWLHQVAFVDPPKLDFDLKLPSESHGSGLLDYVSGWADAFITDKILSQYVLPDHYFTSIDGVSMTPSFLVTAVITRRDENTAGYSDEHAMVASPQPRQLRSYRMLLLQVHKHCHTQLLCLRCPSSSGRLMAQLMAMTWLRLRCTLLLVALFKTLHCNHIWLLMRTGLHGTYTGPPL